MSKRKSKSSPAPSDATVSLTPLAYMLAVINDPTADPARRDRMAICAAQYCHPRAVDNRQTKKALAAAAAKRAGVDDVWGNDLSWPQ